MEHKRQACLVAGEWVTGERWIEVDAPASGHIVGPLQIKYVCLGL